MSVKTARPIPNSIQGIAQLFVDNLVVGDCVFVIGGFVNLGDTLQLYKIYRTKRAKQLLMEQQKQIAEATYKNTVAIFKELEKKQDKGLFRRQVDKIGNSTLVQAFNAGATIATGVKAVSKVVMAFVLFTMVVGSKEHGPPPMPERKTIAYFVVDGGASA